MNPTLDAFLEPLRRTLAERPGEVPEIPLAGFHNASQLINTKLEYVAFRGGHGLRFLTQYGQAAWPINNHDLFYAFTGLTLDERYLIVAIFPVQHPSLPETGEEVAAAEFERLVDNFPAYLVEMDETLLQEQDSAFTPNLSDLDSLLQLMQILES